MGEAKRKAMNGSNSHWYHGTDQYFEEWMSPPVPAKYKLNFPPHSFLCFSRNKDFAAAAGRINGGLCTASITEDAQVLDLRKPSEKSMAVWELVRTTDLGQKHRDTKNFDEWTAACNSGRILKMSTDDIAMNVHYGRLIEISRSPFESIGNRQKAFNEVQQFTRDWIEIVIAPAHQLGFDGVLCNEIDTLTRSNPIRFENLHIFNIAAISKPVWLRKPR